MNRYSVNVALVESSSEPKLAREPSSLADDVALATHGFILTVEADSAREAALHVLAGEVGKTARRKAELLGCTVSVRITAGLGRGAEHCTVEVDSTELGRGVYAAAARPRPQLALV